MNIAIVRAFIALKQLVIEQKDFVQQLQEIRKELHQRIDVHDAQLNQIYEAPRNNRGRLKICWTKRPTKKQKKRSGRKDIGLDLRNNWLSMQIGCMVELFVCKIIEL